METQKPGAIIVYDEQEFRGVKKEDVLAAPDHLSVISRVSADTAGILHRQYRDEKMHYLGFKAFGLEEAAELMRVRTELVHPETTGSIITHNSLIDSSFQSEAVASHLKASDDVNLSKIKVILPLGHRRRPSGQLRAYGVDAEVVTAHEVYIKDGSIDARERNRRIEEISEAYFKLGTFGHLSLETMLILLGIIDKKGLIGREFSKRIRKA